MTTEFFPERTIKYKTYAKRTLVDGLNRMFKNHPDELLQRTKATIEFPRTEIEFPAVVVRMFEREIFNAGVGHEETVSIQLESDSNEIAVTVPNTGGAIQLSWPAVDTAIGYKLYKGLVSNQENQSFTLTAASFLDNGTPGVAEAVPTEVTGALDPPSAATIVLPPGNLQPGTYYYRITALAPTVAVKFKHYFYTADIEFAIYALSAVDRDMIADTLVQTVTMGALEAYTNQFLERIYPSDDLFPDSDLHFININSDQIAGFGESQSETPWGAEDDLIYMSSYRVGVFGELYSLPPTLTYTLVRKVIEYPYTPLDAVPTGNPDDGAPWVSNSF